MRYASLVFCLVLVLFFSACSSGDSTPNDDDTPDGDSEDGDAPSDGDAPDSCPADVYVCQGTQVYHCGDDGKWAYFLDCAEQGNYVCKNGLCVDPSQPDGDVPDGDWPDGDWPDGDWPDGDWPDTCQGACTFNRDISYCLPDGNLCFCEPTGWQFFNCEEICANTNRHWIGCGADSPGQSPYCECEEYPDGDWVDGDPDYPFCEQDCMSTSDCSSGQICGAGGCCTDPCYVTGCPNGGNCNLNNGYCEWCDPPCPAYQHCNYHEDFWYCGSPCTPPCEENEACQGGRCIQPECPPCHDNQYCGPDTGYRCVSEDGCYGSCHPGHVNNRCLDNFNLCSCDPGSYEWTAQDCNSICREAGYDGAEACQINDGSDDACYCYGEECRSDEDCTQAGTGDYCIYMGQSSFCVERCDIGQCGGGVGCVDIGVGDGCGACIDFDNDRYCDNLNQSCDDAGMCHDICGLYEPICSQTCDAVPNSCAGAGELCWPLADANGGIIDGICVPFGASCPDCVPQDTTQAKLCFTEVISTAVPSPICFEIGDQTLMAYEYGCSPCKTVPTGEDYLLTITDCQGNELGEFEMPPFEIGVSMVYAIADFDTDAVIYTFEVPVDEQSCSSVSYQQVLDMVEDANQKTSTAEAMPLKP